MQLPQIEDNNYNHSPVLKTSLVALHMSTLIFITIQRIKSLFLRIGD
jgi:hypothetical protein